jgi:hypothetical protein
MENRKDIVSVVKTQIIIEKTVQVNISFFFNFTFFILFRQFYITFSRETTFKMPCISGLSSEYTRYL